MQELSLRSCWDFSTEALALCHQQPGLTSLDFSSCSELADGALLAGSFGLRHLQQGSPRKLQWLTDAGCTALGGLWEPQSLDMVSRRELAQALCSGCGAPPPVASLSLAYCSSLKVSLPSPSFLTRAGGWGNWACGTREELPGVSVQGIVVTTELGTQSGSGKEPRQTVLLSHWRPKYWEVQVQETRVAQPMRWHTPHMPSAQ